MVARIATGFQNQATLRQLQENNVNLNETTTQITTGFKSDTLLGFSSDANELLNLYDLKKNAEMYLDNISSAESRVKSTESSLQGMSDLLSEAASLWTLGRNESSAETRAALAPKAESLTESFYALLKTKFDGRYIFSGQNGAESPTNATPTATAWPGSPVPTTWYIGDSAKPSIISGPAVTTEYGVVGNETAIANMKAGLEALWYGLQNNSETDMDSAITGLRDAQSGISSLLGDVGGQLNNLDLSSDRHTNNKNFLTEQADELDKVDVAEAITLYSQQQATLEASMMIITRTNQLSLLDFLR